jgi:hypothetical protein
VVGSGLAFEDRGSHQLKGIPGEWRLLAVAREGSGSDDERHLSEIEIGAPRAAQRPSDRVALAMARRAPRVVRTAMRLDPRYRRAVRPQ